MTLGAGQVTLCLPPLCVFQFLLMVNLEKIDADSEPIAWTSVFIPFWVFGTLWLLSESACQCCCLDDGAGVVEFEQLSEPAEQNTRVRSGSQVDMCMHVRSDGC